MYACVPGMLFGGMHPKGFRQDSSSDRMVL